MKRESGLTLLELIFVVALLSIFAAMAAPPLGGIIEQRKSAEIARTLREAVEFTRAAAIGSGGLATLCRSRDGRSCGGTWADGMIVFLDADGERVPENQAALLRVFRFPSPSGAIRWRSFGNRQYLQMTALGFTRNQSGNFTYCPDNGDSRLARQLIINAAGRIREAEDRDGDGLREDSAGRPIECG